MAPLGDAVIHEVATGLEGTVKLLLAHGGLVQEIAGATGNFAVNNTLNMAQVIVHARVHDAQFETVLTAEHVHATSTAGKVDHLLPGYLAWRHAHALTLDAVVAAQQQMAGVVEAGRQGLLDEANLQCQFLEATQRALWFVQVVDFLLDALFQRLISVLYIEMFHFF